MINLLQNVLSKRGPEFVNNFLSENVVITEKLDTYRILFENINDKLCFFKKDNTQINLIERVLTNIWEDAIIELSIILNERKLPEGIRFGVAYTPVTKPIRLEYNNIPKYILTDITIRDNETNKVMESLNYTEVTKWAEILSLGRPPVIFEGKLTEIQKSKIIKYITNDFEDIDNLGDIFNGTYSKANIIEGIIIKTESQLYQIESYEFYLLNESYQKISSSRDFYDLTLLKINSFMDTYKLPYLGESIESDELYLNLICDIFNNYNKNVKIYEDVDTNYLTPPSFGYSGNLNLLLIKNKETLSILENGDNMHKAIFRILLSSFRKYKKPIGLLKESDIQKFNTYVYLINEKCKFDSLGFIPETILINEEVNEEVTQELNESRSDNIVVKELEKRIENSDIDNMRVIASIQKAFKPKAPEIKKGAENCVVYLINPSPITISHQENLVNLHKIWKCPVIVAFVKNNKTVSGKKFIISNKLKKAQIESLADANVNITPAFFALDTWSLTEIFKYCRSKYEPIAIITDNNYKSELILQLYFEEEIMGGRLGVNPDFNIGEIDNKESFQSIRAIEDNNAYQFNQITAPSTWGYFPALVSEYKTWSGIIPIQFSENKFE